MGVLSSATFRTKSPPITERRGFLGKEGGKPGRPRNQPLKPQQEGTCPAQSPSHPAFIFKNGQKKAQSTRKKQHMLDRASYGPPTMHCWTSFSSPWRLKKTAGPPRSPLPPRLDDVGGASLSRPPKRRGGWTPERRRSGCVCWIFAHRKTHASERTHEYQINIEGLELCDLFFLFAVSLYLTLFDS